MDGDLPPGTPPKTNFDGPYWLETQIGVAMSIGLTSFLLFTYCRTRWPVLFAPRTKLTDFSPLDAHTHRSWFAWIIPTIRISEYTVLQSVGLDAAVLLSFFKMSFYLFATCSALVMAILMPVNYHVNGRLDTTPPDTDEGDWPALRASGGDGKSPSPGGGGALEWLDLVSQMNSFLAIPFLFTGIISLLALRALHQNYRRFIRSRQLFSLELVHSIAARTVMVTNLPNHLQGERTLAEYFENMNLPVESVSQVREIGSLKDLIDRRSAILLQLELAWTKYVGNPSTITSYDPSQNVRMDTTPLIDITDSESQRQRLVIPHSPRPTLRTGWFTKKVDALEFWEARFRELDELVRQRRKVAKFKATHVAFVTFETSSSAQIACQVVHAPYHSQCITVLAPEPRDIVWSNMAHSPRHLRVREIIVMGIMILLLLFWIVPISALATLLSYKEIKKALPWLGRIIDMNETVRALVQTSLPSLAVVSLNAALPFLLEWLCYIEGHRARSWVEYSLMKKYFLFLLINVVFIFLLASTYWNLLRDLANEPMSIPEKLATSLTRGSAKHFFLNYVVLQGLGIMPLQLLNLGVVIPRIVYQLFFTRTPRDYAELNAPPMVNYGAVYPQAILVFVITVLYSVIQPLILIFGTIYFGVAYVVYKYKLLFVFYKPYESRGQAWPITFNRLMWGVVLFQILMTGLFIVMKAGIFASLMLPLIAFSVYWGWTTSRDFAPLSEFVSLSSTFDVQRGEETSEVTKLRMGHPVTLSQSTLNRRRYSPNDETLYVAPEEERTDYSQPPMANWYYGVLNTGKRRYGHPALTGLLPQPWLPLKKGQTLANYLGDEGDGEGKYGNTKDAVVLTLRRQTSKAAAARRRVSGINVSNTNVGSPPPSDQQQLPTTPGPGSGSTTPNNPWKDLRPSPSPSATNVVRHRLSFDRATGVIMLPDEDLYGDEIDSSEEEGIYESGESSDDDGGAEREDRDSASAVLSGSPSTVRSNIGSPSKRHSTYYHHPERSRKRMMPGAFMR
ncbi:hypothetical protein FRB94_009930 [Tulasnella sp. JGI-2019a]|nr:hypothetical protein FRB94_009930 [Tulasnella sp. JGI-2019a]KAG9025365.1 hypothetical protein FRB95_010242 [Tulasnella sp. JGI-2019a]